MERAIYGSSAMPVTPQQRTLGQAGRYEGELEARKRARPVRWRGKALSSLDDMLIPLSFKWGRKCVYCGAEHVPLQVEHIVPRAVRVDNRICNLTLACAPCNTKKGTQDIHVFLAGQPDLVARILAQATAPLKDATTVNAIRWRLYEGLLALGLPVECGSGGLTKFNRTRRAFPKTHWLDAACVGKNTPERLRVKGVVPLLIKANGHGCRQLCLMDEHGFPRTKPKQKKFRHLFRTGDIVQARVPAHLKHPGIHVGRVSAKANGAFTIATKSGKVTDIGKKYCRCLQRADGYGYLQKGEAAFLPAPFRGREEMPFFYG